MASITVLDQKIAVNKNDYISLTDIAKYKDEADANDIIRNWLRNRNTLVSGNSSIIPILNPSNSTGLDKKQV
jgi:hypothetical protein